METSGANLEESNENDGSMKSNIFKESDKKID